MEPIDITLTKVKVVQDLRRRILYGILKPNQELRQDKIADELGVSRMPVREALHILNSEGFITFRPNRAAIVNEISDKFIQDFYDVRILLESTAVRRACQNRPDCTPAWQACDLAEKMIERNDIAGFNTQNEAIHRFIWKAADNIKLEQIVSQLWNALVVNNNQPHAETARISNREHRELIRCIETNDPEKAADMMQQHIKRSLDSILEIIHQ